MLPDKDIGCHETGFKMKCFVGVTKHKCQKWIHILGHNPNTGEPMSHWGCVDKFLHLLMIENSQMQRQTGASVDKVATEVAKSSDRNLEYAHHLAEQMRETVRQVGHSPGELLDVTPAFPQLPRGDPQ